MKLRSRGPSSYSLFSLRQGLTNGISQNYNVNGGRRRGRSYLAPLSYSGRKPSTINPLSYVLSRRYVFCFFLGVTSFQIYGAIYFYQSSARASRALDPNAIGNDNRDGGGIGSTLSSLWNAFLQGPETDRINVNKLRNKGYSSNTIQRDQGEEEDFPPREPDSSENSRPRKQRRITRSSRQRRELKKMRSRFQQLQDSGKLLPCQWAPQRPRETQKEQFRPCVPWSLVDPLAAESDQKEGGLQQVLFGNFVGSQQWWRPEKILIRNTFPHDRILSCSIVDSQQNHGDSAIIIPANGGIVELDDAQIQKCYNNGRHRLFQHTPIPAMLPGSADASNSPQTNKILQNRRQVPPIIVLFNGEDPGEARPFTEGNCTIPCHVAGSFELLSLIGIADTNWEIIQSMEGPAYYSKTKINPQAYYQRDVFYATTSFQSEIPVPYFSWAEYSIPTPSVSFEKAIKGASFLANNCNSQSNRERIVEALLKTPLRVDSLSSCLNNAELPSGVTDRNNKTAILEQYLFHLALENQQYDDYITEKLWGALQAGTLPIYMGAPNVKDHVPTNSIIVVDDFDTPQDLANHLIMLTQNKKKYNEYHEWRRKPLEDHVVQKYQFTHVHSTCRICKWAFAKRYGWKFNHSTQEVASPNLPRRTCRNKLGLIGYPIKEYWLSETAQQASEVSSPDSSRTCTLDDSNRILWIGNGDRRIRRTVYYQDGVTDFVVTYDPREADVKSHSTRPSWTLKLETPVRTNNFRLVDGHQSLLQDNQSRITVLTNSDLSNHPPRLEQAGTIEIPITLPDSYSSSAQRQEPILLIQIRIIVEDLDTFHQGGTQRVNYFGKLMTQDFLHPLEAYVIKN